MRIATFLLSSAFLLAACTDNGETTAPASRLAANASGVPSAQADLPPGPTLKPVDQVGWTKVTSVTSGEFSPGVSAIAGHVSCPAGTTLISGGYRFTNEGNPNARPFVRFSHAMGDEWVVGVANFATGAWAVAFHVYALCAS